MKRVFALFILSALLLSAANICQAQKYISKTGHAYFISRTDAIDIDANNHQVASILDAETGDLVIIVLIKAFEFELATADKHFNETYMESGEFPKATFKGKIKEYADIDFSKDGEYTATAVGNLSIHGQTNAVVQTGKVVVKNGKIELNTNFQVSIIDYKIEVPKGVEDRVAKTVDIKYDAVLSKK